VLVIVVVLIFFLRWVVDVAGKGVVVIGMLFGV
jgi:hypothetical protein